jgi:hypothetical protein
MEKLLLEELKNLHDSVGHCYFTITYSVRRQKWVVNVTGDRFENVDINEAMVSAINFINSKRKKLKKGETILQNHNQFLNS